MVTVLLRNYIYIYIPSFRIIHENTLYCNGEQEISKRWLSEHVLIVT